MELKVLKNVPASEQNAFTIQKLAGLSVKQVAKLEAFIKSKKNKATTSSRYDVCGNDGQIIEVLKKISDGGPYLVELKIPRYLRVTARLMGDDPNGHVAVPRSCITDLFDAIWWYPK